MYRSTYTILTCSGDDSYKDAIKLVAAQKGMTIAEMVRAAMDKEYGNDIKQAGVFFASDGSKKKQTDAKKNNGKGKRKS